MIYENIFEDCRNGIEIDRMKLYSHPYMQSTLNEKDKKKRKKKNKVARKSRKRN